MQETGPEQSAGEARSTYLMLGSLVAAALALGLTPPLRAALAAGPESWGSATLVLGSLVLQLVSVFLRYLATDLPARARTVAGWAVLGAIVVTATGLLASSGEGSALVLGIGCVTLGLGHSLLLVPRESLAVRVASAAAVAALVAYVLVPA